MGRRTFGYPPAAHRPLAGFGLVFVVAAPIVLVPSADLFGIEIPFAIRLVLAVFSLVLGVVMLLRAWKRARSEDPSVVIGPDMLSVTAQSGRRIDVHAHEIVAVADIRPVTDFSTRLLLGDHAFRIETTHSGARALRLDVGSRLVDAPLSEVRDAIVDFGASTRRQ